MKELPRDKTILVVLEATEENLLYWHQKEQHRTVLAIYVDREGKLCSYDSWKPSGSIVNRCWKIVAWSDFPSPAEVIEKGNRP